MDFSSLETWGYLAVAFFSFGGSFFIVAAAGVFSYLGHMNLTLALIVASLANFMGDNFLFYLARYHKKEVMPYFKKHRRYLAMATVIMRRYGRYAVFVQKFIYGVKTLVPLVMGMSKYPFTRFVFYNFFASILFVCVIGIGAYFARDTVIMLFEKIKKHPWIAPLFLGAIVALILYVAKRSIKKTPSNV